MCRRENCEQARRVAHVDGDALEAAGGLHREEALGVCGVPLPVRRAARQTAPLRDWPQACVSGADGHGRVFGGPAPQEETVEG